MSKRVAAFINMLGVSFSLFGMIFAFNAGQMGLAVLQLGFLVLNGMMLKKNLGL